MKSTLGMLILAATSALLAGCASVSYQPFEGQAMRPAGEGGTRVVVDGIDFWSHGTPPRPYKLLGVADGEYEHGGDPGSNIRSAIAKEAKKQGGDAVILLAKNTQATGAVMAGTVLVQTNNHTMKFAVVKYQ